MKIAISVALIASACVLAGATNQLVRVRTVTIQYPSDLLGRGQSGTTPYTLDFVVFPSSDFRLMYCDERTLEARISARVCVLDFAYPKRFHKEVNLSPKDTLSEVLKRSGVPEVQDWSGKGHPYVRVIAKRAILAQDGTQQFLRTELTPGDFVVVVPTD
jgi:hypothetical protein